MGKGVCGVTKEKLEGLCEDYFEKCAETGRYCSQAGLMVALDADWEVWERWRKNKRLRGVLDLALARVRDDLEQRSDKMALSLLEKPYGKETPGRGGQITVVFGDGGRVEDYGG